jgi:lipopolysaccharide export system protein LptA
MKTALLLVSVLGFAGLAGGQTPQRTPAQPVVSRANSFVRVGNVMQLRGNVQIQYGGTTVLADEADLPLDANGLPTSALASFALRGNVRVEVSAPVILNPW